MSRAKIVLVLALLSMSSCIHLSNIVTHKNMRHTDPKAHFPNDATSLSDSIQPLHVKCPICKSEGFYIQSVYVESMVRGATNILYSQYVCTNLPISHEWLIGQKSIGGPVSPIVILLK